MDTDPEAEKPNRPETPTANAAEKFLKGFKDIYERQRTESTLDPNAARTQVKEFLSLEEEILRIANTFPFPPQDDFGEGYTAEVSPGIIISSDKESDIDTVGIYIEESKLPFDHKKIELFVVTRSNYEKDHQAALVKAGIDQKYSIGITMYPDPTSVDPILSRPDFPKEEWIEIAYNFDEFGNYLKTVNLPKGMNVDLEKLDIEGSLRNVYSQDMTAEDFEFVGFALNLIKGKLSKAKEENP